MQINDASPEVAEFPNSAMDQPKEDWIAENKRQIQLQYIVTWYLEEYYADTLDEMQGDKDCLEITDISISADDGLTVWAQSFNQKS